MLKRLLALAALAAGIGAAALAGQLARDRQYRDMLAAGELALAQSDLYGAVERFSGALALRPASMVAYYRRAEAYGRQRRDAEAVRDLREAVRLAPDAPQPLVALGEVYEQQGEMAIAAEWYARAADRLKDESPSLLYSLALARYRAAQPAEVIDPLHRAIARSETAPMDYLLGLAYRDIGNTPGAVGALERAIRLDPRLTPAREELADLYRGLGRTDDELQERQILAADHDLGRRIDLALAQGRSMRFEAALGTIADAALLDPNDSRIALAKGRIHLVRAETFGDPAEIDQALASLERALGGTARRSEGLAFYGRALHLSGAYVEAERLLREAVVTSPVAPVAFAFLAEASEQLGHPRDARDALLNLDVLEGDTASAAVRAARARRIGALSLAGGDPGIAVEYLNRAVATGLADAETLGLLAEARAVLESASPGRQPN